MPIVVIDGTSKTKTLTRGEVLPGQVFAYIGREGKPGKNYASVGRNGRMYSVNVDTMELASAAKEDRPVVLTGEWSLHISKTPVPGVQRECRRAEVGSGELFHVKGKDKTYAHMGSISRAREGFLSIPLNNTENHAVTRNGRSNVNVVGTFTMHVTLRGDKKKVT